MIQIRQDFAADGSGFLGTVRFIQSIGHQKGING